MEQLFFFIHNHLILVALLSTVIWLGIGIVIVRRTGVGSVIDMIAYNSPIFGLALIFLWIVLWPIAYPVSAGLAYVFDYFNKRR